VTLLMAIDTGESLSALVTYDATRHLPTGKAKLPNDQVLDRIEGARAIGVELVVVERIQSRGMPVGQDTIDTAEWAGRFLQKARDSHLEAAGIFRSKVKVHLCGSNAAKDSNVRQALINFWGSGSIEKSRQCPKTRHECACEGTGFLTRDRKCSRKSHATSCACGGSGRIVTRVPCLRELHACICGGTGRLGSDGILAGFADDEWAALAVARTYVDINLPKIPFHP
jgi:hypothetical protein